VSRPRTVSFNEVRAAHCPWCMATPGEPCIRKKGREKEVMESRHHKDRSSAAQKRRDRNARKALGVRL